VIAACKKGGEQVGQDATRSVAVATQAKRWTTDATRSIGRDDGVGGCRGQFAMEACECRMSRVMTETGAGSSARLEASCGLAEALAVNRPGWDAGRGVPAAAREERGVRSDERGGEREIVRVRCERVGGRSGSVRGLWLWSRLWLRCAREEASPSTQKQRIRKERPVRPPAVRARSDGNDLSGMAMELETEKEEEEKRKKRGVPRLPLPLPLPRSAAGRLLLLLTHPAMTTRRREGTGRTGTSRPRQRRQRRQCLLNLLLLSSSQGDVVAVTPAAAPHSPRTPSSLPAAFIIYQSITLSSTGTSSTSRRYQPLASFDGRCDGSWTTALSSSIQHHHYLHLQRCNQPTSISQCLLLSSNGGLLGALPWIRSSKKETREPHGERSHLVRSFGSPRTPRPVHRTRTRPIQSLPPVSNPPCSSS